LCPRGVVAVWTINSKLKVVLDWFERNEVRAMEYVVWHKRTKNNKRFTSQGFLLRHAKEMLVIGVRRSQLPLLLQRNEDVFSEKIRETNRKPEFVYKLLDELFPNSRKLELFGRF